MDGGTLHLSQLLTHGGDLGAQVGHEGHVRLLDSHDGGCDCGEV
jgi:hypothetical protein